MKITFISQKGPSFIERNSPHIPVDLAQQCALKAHNHHYTQLEQLKDEWDIVILLIPKTQEDRDNLYSLFPYDSDGNDLIRKAKNISKQVWYMQEGPSWIFQDLPIHQQFWHYSVLSSVDGILCENKTDIPYYEGLVPNKEVIDIPSVMIEDLIKDYPNIEKEEKVMIGGNFCRWYGGFDSYIVAQEFELPIFAPSMGRRIENEEVVPNLTHYPYLNWNEWIKTLATHKYAIHMMPTIAAGTFAMNCAFLGVPCIGYDNADTQRILHPDLSVKMGDTKKARELANKLKNNKKFLENCSKSCKLNYEQFFSEKVFIKHMKKVFKLGDKQ
tara:strand:+ start:910 stop:1893 length:984 start_codon:yes stop_codon:yes gene_type:complete